MATTYSTSTIAPNGFLNSAKDVMHRLQVRATKYGQYRQTVKELSELSDRDLADMGLNRSFIKRMAIEAVYGSDEA